MDEFTVDHSVCRRLRKDTAAQCWALARKLLLGLSLALGCQAALAQAMYRMTDLGPTPAIGSNSSGVALNASGQAAGNFDPNCAPPCGTTSHAFVWLHNGSVLQNLGSPLPDDFSTASAINSSGQVLFDAGVIGSHAFIWKNDGTPAQDLGTLGGSFSSGAGINNAGEVTGTSQTANNHNRAFVWKNNGTPIQDLGTLGGSSSAGEAINNAGEVAGGAATATGEFHVFLWRNNGTPMQDLGTLGGIEGQAYDINDSGEVTGYSSLPGDTARHAFLWRDDGTPMQDLGTIAGTYSLGIAINSMGQVTGDSCWYASCSYVHSNYDHAFFWANNGSPMQDLGTLGGRESHAVAMNNSGQVTGHSYIIKGNTVEHAFLWRNDGTKIQDLNALIDPTDPLNPYVTLTKGDAINDTSQILADGVDSRSGETHAYLLQGTVLTLAPRSLAFGNQSINTASAAKSVTVANTNAKVVAITNIALKGSGSGQFASTNNCGSSLVGHATCTIKVTFKPTAKGAKSATLNVNGGGGGLRVVNLAGTGT